MAAEIQSNVEMSSAPSAPFAPADANLSESTRLLDNHSKQPATLVYARSSSENPHALQPPITQVTTVSPIKPVDIGQAPSNVDEWPKGGLRVPCTHCGHYVETNVNEETEYMGCKPCFNGRPVFRRSFVHYCPNCGEAIGFHYTGEDCFCNHKRSTMQFDRVLAACFDCYN